MPWCLEKTDHILFWNLDSFTFLKCSAVLGFPEVVSRVILWKKYREREEKPYSHAYVEEYYRHYVQVELAPLLSTNRCKPHHRLMMVFPLMAVWMRSDDY